MEARNISATDPYSRPYVVATFEQNEFVSREAITEEDDVQDAVGQPTSRSESSNRANASRSSSRGNGTRTPTEEKRGRSPDAMDIASSAGPAYNPVWKHEVTLWVVQQVLSVVSMLICAHVHSDATTDGTAVTVCIYERIDGQMIEAFLGMVDIDPNFVHGWNVDEWYALRPRQDEPVTGDVRVRMRFDKNEVSNTTATCGGYMTLRP